MWPWSVKGLICQPNVQFLAPHGRHDATIQVTFRVQEYTVDQMPNFTLIGEGGWAWGRQNFKIWSNLQFLSSGRVRCVAPIKVKLHEMAYHGFLLTCQIPLWSLKWCGYGSHRNSKFGKCCYPDGFAVTRRCLGFLICMFYSLHNCFVYHAN